MSEKEEPTQRTPKGAEIPIPKRDDFLRNLEKVATPEKESGDSGSEEEEPEGS